MGTERAQQLLQLPPSARAGAAVKLDTAATPPVRARASRARAKYFFMAFLIKTTAHPNRRRGQIARTPFQSARIRHADGPASPIWGLLDGLGVISCGRGGPARRARRRASSTVREASRVGDRARGGGGGQRPLGGRSSLTELYVIMSFILASFRGRLVVGTLAPASFLDFLSLVRRYEMLNRST